MFYNNIIILLYCIFYLASKRGTEKDLALNQTGIVINVPHEIAGKHH